MAINHYIFACHKKLFKEETTLNPPRQTDHRENRLGFDNPGVNAILPGTKSKHHNPMIVSATEAPPSSPLSGRWI